jgi:hypothetical protein
VCTARLARRARCALTQLPLLPLRAPQEVNKVQLDIRTGHAQTVDKVLAWLSDGALPGTTVCDVRPACALLACPPAAQLPLALAAHARRTCVTPHV